VGILRARAITAHAATLKMTYLTPMPGFATGAAKTVGIGLTAARIIISTGAIDDGRCGVSPEKILQ
jgi:hypothetical protein